MNVVMYSRPGCHLCDDAREAMKQAAFEFDEIDITSDAGLEGEYGNYVPVVEVDGRIVFHAGMDPVELVNEILPSAG